MTGGADNADPLSSVEVYVPSTNTSCSLPSLPVETWGHSQDGLLLCGGGFNEEQCLTFHAASGEWVQTHRLSGERRFHSSWQREDGTVLLMWGENSSKITEIVSDSSAVSTPGFSLKNDKRDACSISDTTSVVITGGGPDGGATSRVSRYNNNGWLEDLPSLNNARSGHGCGLYTTDTHKVYVVMGGCGDFFCADILSSTEMLSEGEDTWRERAPLPRPLSFLRSVSLGNVIYLTGGWDDDDKYLDEIYQLDTETNTWVEVGRMKTPRYVHGLSTVRFSEVVQFCQ